MADEENKEINWTNVIIAIILFVLSSSTAGGMKYLKRIPIALLVGTVASLISLSVGVILILNALNIDIDLNPF